jgi:8-oxo-dGTP pyrophosphatase MutT (NUDIX family)
MSNNKDRGAVIVVAFGERTNNVALVMEPSKPLPHYWKFPGGGIEERDVDPKHPDDDYRAADRAAVREAKEETGLDVEVMRLGVIPKRTHTQYLYIGVADFSRMAKVGGEGEIPGIFSVEEVEILSTFFPAHRPILKMAIAKIQGR